MKFNLLTSYTFNEEEPIWEIKRCKECRKWVDAIHQEWQSLCKDCMRKSRKASNFTPSAVIHALSWEQAVDDYSEAIGSSFRIDKTKSIEDRTNFSRYKAHPRQIYMFLDLFKSNQLKIDSIQDLTFEEACKLMSEHRK